MPKTTLNKDFQKKREENYQKDVEREKMEKDVERDREEKEQLQRENEEMKRQLSKLATVPPPSSSTLQVNLIKHTIMPMFCPKFSLYLTQCIAFKRDK